MPPPAALHTTACLENLATIRGFVQQAGMGLGGRGEALIELVRAVDEAATNIIMHGECTDLPLTVEMRRDADRLVVTLMDHGTPYDPTSAPPPDLSAEPWERTGGLGVYLMRELTDELSYRAPPGGGNELRLVKRLAEGTQDL